MTQPDEETIEKLILKHCYRGFEGFVQGASDAARAILALFPSPAEQIALANLRSCYDAFSAMRNDLNEILGDMISQEATLKDGPEMSAECAAVVDAVSRFKDRQAERIAELERALRNVHHYGLVIDSAVRYADFDNKQGVCEMLAQVRAALASSQTGTPDPRDERIAELERARDTLASVVQSMTSACVMVREIASPTIRLGNGKETAIEMRDGERGWLLHDDGIVMLQTAEQAGVSTLAALASAQTGTATTGAGHD